MANEGVFVDACGIERDISGEFTVVLKGFKTLEDANLFISWFDGAGEQDAYLWFAEHGDYIYGTSGAKNVIEGNQITATLYASPKDEDDLEDEE